MSDAPTPDARVSLNSLVARFEGRWLAARFPDLTVVEDRPGGPPAGGADRPPADRYELHGELGRGGMGCVLRGFDRHLGRELAVKVLLDRHADSDEARRRFAAEARVM